MIGCIGAASSLWHWLKVWNGKVVSEKNCVAVAVSQCCESRPLLCILSSMFIFEKIGYRLGGIVQMLYWIHMIYSNHSIQWHFSKSSQCDFSMSTSWNNSSSNKTSLFTIRRSHMLHPTLWWRRRRQQQNHRATTMTTMTTMTTTTMWKKCNSYDAANIIIIFHRVYENWISIFPAASGKRCAVMLVLLLP